MANEDCERAIHALQACRLIRGVHGSGAESVRLCDEIAGTLRLTDREPRKGIAWHVAEAIGRSFGSLPQTIIPAEHKT